MQEHQNTQKEPTEDELSLEDLVPTMTTHGSVDPGPDPTWDPDEFPWDDLFAH